MATIRDLISPALFNVEANASVYEAAAGMAERNIGAAPVLQDSKLVGIFSERDVMNRVVVESRDPKTTRVFEVMTTDPCTVQADETVERCMLLMKQHGFRHLPIVDGGSRLVGMIAMRDLLLHDLDEKEIEVKMMRAYMSSGGLE